MNRLPILILLCVLQPLCAFAAPGWVFEKVALSGETAPGTARTYASFDNARDAGADAAFGAMLSGAPLQFGSFRRDAGIVTAVSFAGDPAPGTGGGTLSILFPTPSRAGGVVSFAATVTGGTASNGIFFDAGAGDAAALLFGNLVPGGGTFAPSLTDTTIHSVNASGEVAFRSALAGTTPTQGVFTSDGAGGFTSVALEGDPVAEGGTFSVFGWPSHNGIGEVAFDAEIASGTATSGVFLDSGGVTTIALAGDVAPGTGGGVFDFFALPFVNSNGDVAFLSESVGGTANGGYFVATAVGIVPVVVENQVMPGTGGRGMTTFGPSFPNLNASGETAFAGLLSGEPATSGMFVHDVSTGVTRLVAISGEVAPAAGGATFTLFESVGIDDSGVISFEAQLSDGRSGIFVAAVGGPAVPSIMPMGLAVLAIVLVAIGAGLLPQRSRQRT